MTPAATSPLFAPATTPVSAQGAPSSPAAGFLAAIDAVLAGPPAATPPAQPDTPAAPPPAVAAEAPLPGIAPGSARGALPAATLGEPAAPVATTPISAKGTLPASTLELPVVPDAAAPGPAEARPPAASAAAEPAMAAPAQGPTEPPAPAQEPITAEQLPTPEKPRPDAPPATAQPQAILATTAMLAARTRSSGVAADASPEQPSSATDTAFYTAPSPALAPAAQPMVQQGATLQPTIAAHDLQTPGQPQPPHLRMEAAVARTSGEPGVQAQPANPAGGSFSSLLASAEASPAARMGAPEAQPAAAPAPVNLPPALTAASAPATAHPVVHARPGQIGQELGVQIARTVSAKGEEVTVRLNPVEMGRIEVRLSFDDNGSLRARVAADSPIALDMLRRDAADLGRALADAGIRSDAQSFRFDSRSGGGSDGAPFGQRQHQGQHQGGDGRGYRGGETADEPVYRSLRSSGQVDLMA